MRRLVPFVILGVIAVAAGCGDRDVHTGDGVRVELAIEAVSAGYVGLPITLRAHALYPAEDLVVAWRFDAPDAVAVAVDDADAVGVDVEAVWRVPGTYTVRATAVTPAGARGHASLDITIGADFVPPTVRVPSTIEAVVDQRVVLDGSRSTDNAGIARWAWDADLGGGAAVDADGPILVHRYTRPGTYYASLTVWDAAGLHASSTVRVTVRSVAETDEGTIAPAAGASAIERSEFMDGGGGDVDMARSDDVAAWPDALYVVGEPVEIAGPGHVARIRVEARYPNGGVRDVSVEAVRVDGDVARAAGDRVQGQTYGTASGIAEVSIGSHAVDVPFDLVVRPTALARVSGAWQSVPAGVVGRRVDRLLDVSQVPGRLFMLVELGDSRFLDVFDPSGNALSRVDVPADTTVIVAESPTIVWTIGPSVLGRWSEDRWTEVATLDRSGVPRAAVWGDLELHVWFDGSSGAERAIWRVDDHAWRAPGASRRVDPCRTIIDAQRVGDRVVIGCNAHDGGRVIIAHIGATLVPLAMWRANDTIRSIAVDSARGHVVVVSDHIHGSRLHRLALANGDPVASTDTDAQTIAPTAAGDLLVGRVDGVWMIGDSADRQLRTESTDTLVPLPPIRRPIVLSRDVAWVASAAGSAPDDWRGIYGPPHGVGGRAQNAVAEDLVALEDGARLVVELDGLELIDGPGTDLVVFENPFEVGRGLTRWMEPGVVEFGVGSVSCAVREVVDPTVPAAIAGDPARYVTGFFGIAPVRANPDRNDLVPGHVAGGGDGFDLGATRCAAADRVELVDVAGDGFSPDIDAIALVHWRRVIRPAR